MRIELFEMERMQSIWENQVLYNLSESGVHPLRLSELMEGTELAELEETSLGYSQTNGTVELRQQVSDLYPGAGSDNVIVTNGTAEANFISVLNLVNDGDEVVVMLPNYMQIWGLARSLAASTKPFPLREQNQWAPDLDELRRAVNDKTRLIAICNPNNPSGAVLSDETMRRIVDEAERVGAWILADEVYQGAELDGVTSPSFWGSYDRILVTGGLSKAYGLPGLRIGWVVGPSEKIGDLWAYKDYTSIAPGALSDHLAQIALAPERRAQLLERTRAILREQLPLVQNWIDGQGDVFHMVPPRAGAFAVLRYHLQVNSTELADRLREEKSVLIVPGDQFHLDHHLRIGYGGEPETLKKGLALFSELLEKLRPTA